jgi:hypothetical protein
MSLNDPSSLLRFFNICTSLSSASKNITTSDSITNMSGNSQPAAPSTIDQATIPTWQVDWHFSNSIRTTARYAFKSVRFFREKSEQAGVGQSPTLLAVCPANGVLRILRGYDDHLKVCARHKPGTQTGSHINNNEVNRSNNKQANR